ncbi:TrkH family potassium uptake protein [Sinomonas halotolerans]|uniref:Potassium transporter TrkG n=1 Tax=Sinomonas halotolerans TaxID=1644133 RepID=A0ABU9X1I6_9MICC
MAETKPMWTPAPEREGLGPLTGPRDFLDRVAASSPARLAMLAFVVAIALFTALLSLPIAAADGQRTPFHEALFTAVSAVTVTGLAIVSTPEHWTLFGQACILLGIFTGGLGTLTLASLLSLMVSRRLGLRGRLIAQEALNNSSRLGEVGELLRIVIGTSVVIQGALGLVMAGRLTIRGEHPLVAAWHGVFYGISSFNNAGFVLHEAGAAEFAGDLWMLGPIGLGVFLGSLGFPVVLGILQGGLRPSRWNLHVKLTITVSVVLLVAGAVLWGWMEWDNPRTLAGMPPWEKAVNAVFASINTRSGGFNVVDQNAMEGTTLLLSDALMFAGGGSVSTAGGIKVTTLAVMFLAIVAEARGVDRVEAFGRTIPEGTMRVAVAVIMAAATWILVGCFLMLAFTDLAMDRVLFEVISAFATVGLSTGVSAESGPAGAYILTVLMFTGRIGTITLASALAVRQRIQLYHYPEERPIIG